MSIYTVEIGWKKGAYTVKLRTSNRAQAEMIYAGYNVHSGGKKRLKRDGTVIARAITDRST